MELKHISLIVSFTQTGKGFKKLIFIALHLYLIKCYLHPGICININMFKSNRQRFAEICSGKVKLPGLTVMKDVAIAKSEFVEGEKAVTKIQDFQHDDVLFEYCCLPEVSTK